jgi:NSS family neurotransmitter:Na+ symporter
MYKNRFSRIGFILAAAGSAVGLGNIWKFPYITGENGGGVFVLVYLLTVLFIGMSIFLAEVLVGSTTNKDSVSAIEELAPKGQKWWKYTGFTFLTGVIILSFYSIVVGWILNYIVIAATALPQNVAEAEKVFMGLLQKDITSQLTYYTLAFAIIAYTISKGIKKGIEKLNNVLMPALLVILIVMFAYSLSLEGFSKAFEFMFSPNFEKFHTSSIILAVGHAFFTLSIGMATILAYSASLDRHVNIVKASISIVALDTIIAIVAGLIIFSVLFTAGQEPGKGAGLVFITLPAIFYEMGSIGGIMAIAFFVALAFASITSAVSVLEPTVKYLVERKKMSRNKATYSMAAIFYVLGLFALLSNTSEYSASLTFGSKNVFDWFDFITASILMPLGGILLALFVGYAMDKEKIRNTLVPYMGEKMYRLWFFLIRYVAPISVFAIFLNETGILKLG